MSAIGAAGDDYVAFCEGLRQICGVDLSQYKRPQMERRLRSFFARKGIHLLTDCLDALRKDKTELDALLDRVTINVSQLWRHPEQWVRLERDVLPELAASGQVRAWSAGCSYGAEATTLAAVCHKAIPTARVKIIGTDIDKRMIERARAGVFSAEDARGVDIKDMERAFDRVPEGWRAKDALRRMMTLRDRRPAAPAAPDRQPGPDHVPQHRHLLRRADPRRAARAPRPGAASRRVPGRRRHRASLQAGRSGTPDGPPLHLPESVMDTSEYMPMFLAEAQEHLQELNLAIVRLEEDPKTARRWTRSSASRTRSRA